MRTGTLLRNFLETGTTPNPAELVQIERDLNNIESLQTFQQNLQNGTGNIDCASIRAQESDFSISPLRAVTFSGVTNGVIPNNTETILSFDFTRGFITPSDACVVFAEGHTDRFTKAPGIPSNRDVLVFGDVTWGNGAPGIRDLYIKYYNADGEGGGGFLSSLTPSDWVTHSFVYYDELPTGWYVELSVYQNSGSAITLQTANLGFALL